MAFLAGNGAKHAMTAIGFLMTAATMRAAQAIVATGAWIKVKPVMMETMTTPMPA